MGWPQDAYVGQKVVCIDNNCYPTIHPWFPGAMPIINETYTIKEIFIKHSEVILRLHELYNYSDLGYRAFRFKPVLDRPTDISIFTAMLGPKAKEEV